MKITGKEKIVTLVSKEEELKIGDEFVILASVKETIKELGWHEDIVNYIGEVHTVKSIDGEEIHIEKIPFFYLKKDVAKIIK